MSFLTDEQKKWLRRRVIKVNELYMFPRFGFSIYDKPKVGSGSYLNTNPFTKSLDSQSFVSKEIVNEFVRGNFYSNPTKQDFYLKISELEKRDMVEMLFLYAFVAPLLAIYNVIKGCKP